MANANDDASTTTTPRMTTEEKFAFDLRGFVVVRGVYDAEQVRKMNAAIDARESEIVERQGRLRLGGEAGDPPAGDGATGAAGAAPGGAAATGADSFARLAASAL